MIRHIPNSLSVSRIAASLLLIVIFNPQSNTNVRASIILVLAIMFSDFLDGYLARKIGATSRLGYLLDGLGDRSFHVSTYLILVSVGTIGSFLAWVLIFREICQYAIRLIKIDWVPKHSGIDRIITKTYTGVVQFVFLYELLRIAFYSSQPLDADYYLVSFLFAIIATASFTRLIPQVFDAWREEINV